MKSSKSFAGVMDSTPPAKSDTLKSQAPREPQNLDYRGIPDSTPSSSAKSPDRVKVGR